MKLDAKIFVAGHRGLVGSAIVRLLQKQGFTNLLLRPRELLDLTSQSRVSDFFRSHRPEYVFLAAAKVGGIWANSQYPADFIYENMQISSNVIRACHIFATRKLVNLGSSCIYPRDCPQPIRPEYLMTGPLEDTNRAYAMAKIAAIEMCDAYRYQHGCAFVSVMPTNLYGPNDRDGKEAHVIPALIRKFKEAKDSGGPVTLWGTGEPLREFLHVDDMARACLHVMENISVKGPINAGSGDEITIKDLAYKIASLVGYPGEIVWDDSQPDGTPRKLLDSSVLRKRGWAPEITLADGLRRLVNA